MKSVVSQEDQVTIPEFGRLVDGGSFVFVIADLRYGMAVGRTTA